MDPITVLVVDRDRAVAQAIARRLSSEVGVEVVGSAHTAVGAIRAAARDWPDVVLLDEAVVDGDLADVIGQLLEPHGGVAARLMVTSDSEDAARAYECVRAGAAAFVGKTGGFDELVRTLFGVVAGETRIAPGVLSEVLDRFRRAPAVPAAETRPFPRLTEREREVLECLTAGLDRHHIARRLGVSVHTVRTHAQSLFAKLEVHSSVEAVSVATRAGVLGAR